MVYKYFAVVNSGFSITYMEKSGAIRGSETEHLTVAEYRFRWWFGRFANPSFAVS